jgi:hypothetical protein
MKKQTLTQEEIKYLKDLCKIQEQPKVEVDSILGEIRKVKELGIKITKVIFKGKSYNEIQTLIPKGWRMLNLQEGQFIVNSEDLSRWTNFMSKNDDFFIKQPFKLNEQKGYVARFLAGSDWVGLFYVADPTNSDSDLGVILCRELK